ncbi:T9SS type B sorting domain-containing protein [Polaribacter sp.]|uniref:T9SS type B sorting domain-containing protein n=1 Tax=Polaribacter sp. TaxID=1920175 RepID=UPI003F698225
MKQIITFLFFSITFLSSNTLNAQLSKKHFIPPLTYAESGNANPENQYIYISTPSSSNVSFTIRYLGNTNNDITGIVSKESPKEYFITNQEGQLFVDSRTTSVVYANKGFIIEADDVIYVSVRVIAGSSAQAGALVSKGSSALGTTFRAGMFTNENPQTNYLNFISVMASEDNTLVTFDDLPNGLEIKNYTGTFPITVGLNEGESYVVATNASEASINRDGLIGTLINSDKPIVVNSGSANGSFHNGGGRDYGIDQIVGLDKVGSDYIFVKGGGSNGWENALIIAHEDNTSVSINGNTANITLNSGEYTLIEGDQFNSDGNLFVKTSKPVFAYQGIGANTSEANQGLFFVPPLSCESRGNIDNIPFIESIGNTTFSGGITIVTNVNATVTINELPITNFTTSGPFQVDTDNDGFTNYVTYKVTNLGGNVSVKSTDELYCAYFNENGAATSGSFFSGFPSAPEINFNTSIASLGNCIPNITLQATNTSAFNSLEWQFYDETTGNWVTKSNNQAYKPIETEPGRYRLVGIVDCTGARFESIEIPVSLCPDDYDNDLIIDNLDIDLDNDGILNTEESLGEALIDFSNLSNPSLEVNNSIITDFFTTELSKTGDVNLVGTVNGNFNSSINDNSNQNASSIYILNSLTTFSFEFIEDVNQPHSIKNGEVFEIGIGPASKNITLIDPDNILLIDTNFDGDFEDGITNYSNSLIRFTYNPTPNGATPFKFIATDVDKIVFLHAATSNVTNSNFNGNLKIIDFKKDSDGDGIEDALDLDSDNDGIPDLFEAANQNITLLNTDSNLDGLDDVFDTVTLISDTDGDGVLNYLDLDSDNDGIYDLIESGFTLTDANNDGVIDNANAANVGVNGLLDSLESTPDSGILATALRNSDATSVVTSNQDPLFDFVDLDADGDDCFDVIEAGFTGNGSGILFANPFATDTNGLVINNTDGYTTPNADYITSAPIIVNSFADPVFCELNTDVITIDSNADTFQWQVSTDGENWTNLSNDATYNGVTTKDLQITETPLSFHNNQYRVFLSKVGNSCIEEESNPVVLTVNPLPNIKNTATEIFQCIDEMDTNPTVNLTTAENNISETVGVSFQYFTDSTTLNQITNPTSYPVTVNTSDIVYVNIISNQGCSNGVVTLTINVGQTPDNPYNAIQPPVCDDLLDAEGNDTPGMNDDTDFITNFSLDKDAIINNINPPINTEVFFFENASDRNNSLNEIDITNYRNNINKIDITTIPEGIQFPIYYKIISTINNDCQGLGEFFLQIHAVPQANTVSDIELCDDALTGNTADGRNALINLREKVTEILGTEQTEADYEVTFHTTKDGAMNDSDIITNDTNYTNQAPIGFIAGTTSEQTIYVRVQNLIGNRCFNANTSFKISIQPIPTVPADVPDIIICDVVTPIDADPRNRIAQNIDLTERETDILDGRTGLIVEYYISQQDAENRTNAILDPSNFQNTTAETTFPSDFSSDDPGIQTIFFIIVDENGLQCPSVFSTFQLLIYPEPSVNPVSVLSECDTNADGDDANGIIQTIDLNSKIPEIVGANRNVNDFNVTFHSTPADATSGNNPLASPYQNSNPTETIFVRIQNKQTSCVNDDASFQLIVNPLPNFTITTPQILCLNDLPYNISVENPSDNYTYVWTDENGTLLNPNGSVDNIDISSGGNYNVVATTTDGTLCSRVETIEVIESNIATLESSFITIVDEGNNIGSTDNLSISIDTITNNLGPGDYQFAIINTESGIRIPFIGYQDAPLFENLEGGIYQVIVNDKNGCSPDTSVLVSVLQFPKFFTPNGDNRNDTWKVKGANLTFYPNASVNIFNRFGKLIAQVPIDSIGWDGTSQGKRLPSDDYWYNITLVPADTSKPTIRKKGNFSLLRK